MPTGTVVPVVGSERNLLHVPLTVSGRVVMRFEDASDTRPQYASHGGSLWIYDVATTAGAEALRLDAHTGKLLQTVGLQGAYGAGHVWELTCGAKMRLLRVDPDSGALTPAGRLPRASSFCDASITVAAGDVIVLDGQKLYVYGY